MKDIRIWIVIGCILAIGSGVTYYTNSYISSQSAVAQETSLTDPEDPDGLGEESISTGSKTTAESLTQQKSAAESWQENRMIPATGIAPFKEGTEAAAEPEEEAAPKEETANEENRNDVAAEMMTASALSGEDAGLPVSADENTEEAALKPAGEEEARGMAEEDGAETEQDSQTVREPRSREAAQSLEVTPISPPASSAASVQEKKSDVTADYKQRLRDLDTQIQKIRTEETDSNVYSIKTSAETELKMWESEMSTVYNALLNLLPEAEASQLVKEQQEWMKKRESRAMEGTGKNSGSVESIGYAAALVKLTRARAYKLADLYEKAAEAQAGGAEAVPQP